MEITIGILTALLVGTLFICIRQASRIGILESTIKNEDKRFNDLITKTERTETEHNESVSSLTHELNRLKKEIEHLKSSNKFNETIQAKTDFDVFEQTLHNKLRFRSAKSAAAT